MIFNIGDILLNHLKLVAVIIIIIIKIIINIDMKIKSERSNHPTRSNNYCISGITKFSEMMTIMA